MDDATCGLDTQVPRYLCKNWESRLGPVIDDNTRKALGELWAREVAMWGQAFPYLTDPDAPCECPNCTKPERSSR